MNTILILSKRKRRLAKANNLNRLAELRKTIELNKARIDAHEQGFQALTQEFLNAQQEGDYEQATRLANRLQAASAARLNDGTFEGWDKVQTSDELYDKVLSLAGEQKYIKLPPRLSETQSIFELYRKLTKEGHKVTIVEGYDDKGHWDNGHIFERLQGTHTGEEQGDFDNTCSHLIQSGKQATGLAFKHSDGRFIRVTSQDYGVYDTVLPK